MSSWNEARTLAVPFIADPINSRPAPGKTAFYGVPRTDAAGMPQYCE